MSVIRALAPASGGLAMTEGRAALLVMDVQEETAGRFEAGELLNRLAARSRRRERQVCSSSM